MLFGLIFDINSQLTVGRWTAEKFHLIFPQEQLQKLISLQLCHSLPENMFIIESNIFRIWSSSSIWFEREFLREPKKVWVNIQYIYLIQFVQFDNSTLFLRPLAVEFLKRRIIIFLSAVFHDFYVWTYKYKKGETTGEQDFWGFAKYLGVTVKTHLELTFSPKALISTSH